jgi:hypothetical protein
MKDEDSYILPLSQKKVPRKLQKTKIRSIFVDKNSNTYESKALFTRLIVIPHLSGVK